VTHKGAAADAGHYIGFVKKGVFHPGADDEEDWYKFDDDKVSSFPAEKLPTLEGGGKRPASFSCVCVCADSRA
jgi:ubiquitin carboxyl-terminal hydrolase 14